MHALLWRTLTFPNNTWSSSCSDCNISELSAPIL